MMKRITKLPAALALPALLALVFFAAPRAEALERVCMRANFGIGYIYQFQVSWHQGRIVPGTTGHRSDWSEDVYLGRNRCLDVSDTPDNALLNVAMREFRDGTFFTIYCRDWENRARGVAVAHPHKTTLWLDAWGISGYTRCKLWKYE